MDYHNILVGTDGTVIMDAVFDKCTYLVRLMGATIHVAYVLDITGLGAQPIDATWGEMYHCQISSEAIPQGSTRSACKARRSRSVSYSYLA